MMKMIRHSWKRAEGEGGEDGHVKDDALRGESAHHIPAVSEPVHLDEDA